MTSLLDYTDAQFPNHTSEVWGPEGWTMMVDEGSVKRPSMPIADAADGAGGDDLSLTDHTVVAHVIGATEGLALLERLRDAGWQHRLSAVLVCPAAASVVPGRHEDREGIVDLPIRRITASAVVGAAVAGLSVALVVGLATNSVVIGSIVGVFAAVMGAFVAGMIGGGGRFAGEHAWSQPHIPGQTMAVVAAFADTSTEAHDAARLMEASVPHEIRILNGNGAWHAPNT